MRDTTVPGLRVATRRGFVVVTLPAQVGRQNYAGIRTGVCRALALAARPAGAARRPKGVVVDFGDSILLDASGLVLLARAETRARDLGCPLRAVVPVMAAPVRCALHATGLSRLVPVFPDVAAATAAPLPDGTPAGADTTHVLDALRLPHPDGPETAARLATGPAPAGTLAITTSEAGDGDHTVVHLSGVLDQTTVRRLGETLTTLVEGNLRHLMVRMGDRLGLRCDPLPILLGIRWRVAAEGGCLSLPGLPARLREAIDREGLGAAFTACRTAGGPLAVTEPA
ncbi:hypothetical protein [Actinomadura roseirufa]|uniref:hypothetical protein n=1 Tax=Actinomadura roseirufa TaxID=2094049 RepID=UPI001040E750|nr:hypothetical protein [Actinomadura roseirufa]